MTVALDATVARLMGLVVDMAETWDHDSQMAKAVPLESALREALAQDRADAERYRWLRDAGIGFDIGVREESDDGEDWVHGYPPDELDEAVDAAIAAERGE